MVPKSNKKYAVNTAVKIMQKFKNVSLKLTYFLKTKNWIQQKKRAPARMYNVAIL